jgi:hypothetical protein
VRALGPCEATLGAGGAKARGAASLFQVAGGECHRLSSGADGVLGVGLSPVPTQVGLVFSFVGGDACAAPAGGAGEVNRTGVVSLECFNGRAPENRVEEVGHCTYRITLQHVAGCPLQCPRDGEGAVCGGRTRGECLRDPAAGAARCACREGHSGDDCSTAPSQLPAPTPEPSAAAPPPPRRAVGAAVAAAGARVAPPLSDGAGAAAGARSSGGGSGGGGARASSLMGWITVYFPVSLVVVWAAGGGLRGLRVAAGARTLRGRLGALLPFVALCALLFVVFPQVWGGGGAAARAAAADAAPRFAAAVPPLRAAAAAPAHAPFGTLKERLPALPPHTLASQRVFIRTFNVRGGGPQCLANIAWAFHAAVGVRGTFVTTRAPLWDFYVKNISVGDCVAGSREAVACRRGDVVVNHEFFQDSYDPSLGLKQFIWELGDVPLSSSWQATHGAAKYLGHSFYTRDFVLGSRYALLRQFVPPGQWGELPASPEALRARKGNLVLLDDEGTEDVVRRLEPLRARWPDLEVVVLKGFTWDELKDLFLRAKVLIDAGMRGMERISVECLQFFVVPLHVSGGRRTLPPLLRSPKPHPPCPPPPPPPQPFRSTPATATASTTTRCRTRSTSTGTATKRSPIRFKTTPRTSSPRWTRCWRTGTAPRGVWKRRAR